MPTGKLNHDLVVGASHDIPLKAGQAVQVMGQSAGKVVIMVTLADGSNGVFQVDAADVTITPAASATPPPAPPPPAPVAASPMPAAPASPPPPPTPPAPAGPPTYPDDFVGGGEVQATTGTHAAGTASVVHLKGQTQSYIVSARHLLGPMGGFPTQTAAKDVPSVVQSISIDAFSGGQRHYDVTGLLVPANHLKADGGDPVDDMAVYLNHDSSSQDQAVPLADHLPATNAPVWVIAHVRGGVPESQVIQPGKVIEIKDGWIVFQFDNDKIITAGASGAPVLDASGEVIGVYSGHSNNNGHVFGWVIPATMIAKVIQQAAPPAVQ